MFKDKLKELRESKGLSQQALANKLFVSRSAVAKWENGLGLPSEESFKLLCEYFLISKEELLEENDAIIVCQNLEERSAKRDITAIKILLIFIILVIVSTILYNTYKDEYNNLYEIDTSVGYYDKEIMAHDINLKYKIDYEKIRERITIYYDEVVIYNESKEYRIENDEITFLKTGKIKVYARFIDNKDKKLYTFIILTVYCYDSNNVTLVNDLNDLYNINKNLSGTYILNSDIDLTGENYMPIHGDFSGVFINPNNYVIKNMNIEFIEEKENSYYKIGLFSNIQDAYINNIIIENITINPIINDDDSCELVGAICGSSVNSEIENCKITGIIKGKNNVGGISGYSRGTRIVNCMFVGEVIQDEILEENCFAGGIIGYADYSNKVINNIVNAKIYSTAYAGGIVGLIFYLPNDTFYTTLIDNTVLVIIDAPYLDKMANYGHIH